MQANKLNNNKKRQLNTTQFKQYRVILVHLFNLYYTVMKEST